MATMASSRRGRPVYTFIPYTINNKPYMIASYLCTPLVRFSLDSLKGSKVVGHDDRRARQPEPAARHDPV